MNNPEGLPLLTADLAHFAFQGLKPAQQEALVGQAIRAIASGAAVVVPASPVAPAERERFEAFWLKRTANLRRYRYLKEQWWEVWQARASLPQHPGQHQELLRRADEFAKVGAVVPIDMVTTSKMARLIADLAAALRGAAPPTDKNLGG
jgi:hypothetical protein